VYSTSTSTFCSCINIHGGYQNRAPARMSIGYPVECIAPRPVSELFIPIDVGLYNPLTLPAGQWPGSGPGGLHRQSRTPRGWLTSLDEMASRC
jgi:hypothetical protein